MGPLVNAIGTHIVVPLSASLMAFVSAIAASVFVVYKIREEDGDEEGKNKEAQVNYDSFVKERQPLLN